MKCEVVEKKIVEILEGKSLDKKVLGHIQKCNLCRDFYNYIVELKEEIKKVKRLEPAPYLEERIISSLLKEPIYQKVFAFLLSVLTLLFIIFLPHLFRFSLPHVIIFFSKILALCEILSRVFNFKIYYLIPSLIFTFILINMSSLVILFLLFKKLAYREVKL